jgi:hypothetical protein
MPLSVPNQWSPQPQRHQGDVMKDKFLEGIVQLASDAVPRDSAYALYAASTAVNLGIPDVS